MKQTDAQWAAQEFGIEESEFLWYNGGSCYDRIGVNTKEAADKIAEKVKGKTANGGMLDGMPLGAISVYTDDDGKVCYDITC